MAKKRDRSKKPAGTQPAAAPSPVEKPAKASKPDKGVAVVPLPSEQPAFWFGYDVAWAKVWLFRVLVFSLLAIDAVLQIRHAPRYGAGDFNVAQLPLLDGLAPGRVGYEVAQLVAAYLFILAAFGVATRVVVPCVTAIYAWLYFSSQLDGYQHHYLVVLLLGIACFVPWHRPADGAPVRSWALRLILVQLAVLYLWAAISKMDAAWLDGRTLAGQITGPLREIVDSSVGIKAAARFTIIVELALALTVWVRPAWFIALPLGIGFHTSILLSGLEIGLFAWLMLAMYVLVVPDRVWTLVAETPPLRVVRGLLDRLRGESDLVTGIAVVLGTGSAALLAAIACRFENALTVAVALGLVPILVVVGRRLRGRRGGAIAGVAHLVGILVWIAVDRASTVAVDYYRFWGGSQRRLGNSEVAERAYRSMIEIAPDEGSGHYQLGRLLLKRGDDQGGLDELRKAQAIETARARSYVAEAQYLAQKGRGPEAIEKAREATYAEPDSKEANDLLNALTGQKREPGAAPAGSDDDSDQR